MKTVNSAVYNAIRKNYQVEAQPLLTAEWNMNRYYDTVVDNTPSEDTDGYDIEIFPIESIVEPFRPTKGILKARTDEAIITDLDRSGTSRYYIASDDDVYHYWSSPTPTDVNGNFTTTVRPQVIYSADIQVNKLVIKIENFWATPNIFYIRTTTSATPVWNDVDANNDWKVVSTSPVINSQGEIILYWNGTSWSTTKPSNLESPPLKTIRGLMIDVRQMAGGRDGNDNPTTYHNRRRSGNTWIEEDIPTNGRKSFFNLIELSARREVNLTSSLISVSDEFDIAADSDLYPIGTLTTNGGSLTLSNLYTELGQQKTGYFNRDNSSSPYKDIVQPGVKFKLEYIYNINNVKHSVQAFEFYGDEWTGQKDHEISISLTDASKFLEEITPPAMMYENMTVPEIFMRILDCVGFVNWVFDDDDRNERSVIPVFYTDGEKNVWEILDDLAKGTQTAIYFDAFGKMNVKTRWAAFNNLDAPVWNFRGENSGDELSDIIELSEEGEVGSNHLTVTYQATTWDKWNNGSPSMQKVWAPDGTVTLRSAPLLRNMDTNDNSFFLTPKDAAVWPYAGIVQIEGELIKYKGKRFAYYTGSNGKTRNVAVVNSNDEKRKYNNKTLPQFRGQNGFTGGFMVEGSVADSRGYWNSDVRSHKVDLGNYTVRRTDGATVKADTAGLKHLKQESQVRISSHPKANNNDATIATSGPTVSTPYRFYGTKFKFVKEKGLNNQRAGLFLHGQGGGNQKGYFIDLIYTTDNKTRQQRHELAFYAYNNGKLHQLTLGVPVAVALNTFYQIDAIFQMNGDDHKITVMFNGRVAMVVNIQSSSPAFVPATGQFGMFVRGKAKADFEYLYGVARNEKVPQDDSTFFDLVRGGYTGDYFMREFIWGWKTRKKRKKKKWVKEKYRWNQYFFDEFGPYVHEVREFNVKFEPKPVNNSRLYMSNDWGIICTEYRSSPFGARFVLTNVSRRNEIANGDDNITFGGKRTVPQVLTAIGRVLVLAEEAKIEKKNEDSIRVRGKIEAELTSPWIQTKAMADNIANWMDAHWSDGMDEVTLKVFGNPLIELTDVVAINYDEKYMTTSTHKYYVTGISTSFEAGIETDVKLRRVRI